MLVFTLLILYTIFSSIGYKDPKIIDAYEGRYGNLEALTTNYLGGFADISIKQKTCDIIFFQDKIKVLFRLNDAFRDVKEISNQNIISAEYATDSYIDQQISLGGLIVFGWAGALAFKSNTKVIKEYVMLKFIDEENKERAIIFDGYDNDILVKRLIKQRKVC